MFHARMLQFGYPPIVHSHLGAFTPVARDDPGSDKVEEPGAERLNEKKH